jgi:hypothetical protein
MTSRLVLYAQDLTGAAIAFSLTLIVHEPITFFEVFFFH